MTRHAGTALIIVVILATLTILPGTPGGKAEDLESQYWLVLSRSQLQALMDVLSGETIVDSIRYIAQYWRWAPSHGFHTVAEYMVAKAKSYGLEDAHIEKFISDKKTRYFGQTMNRPSWDPVAADVWVVEPIHQKVTSFTDIPMCLAGYSRNTDVTAEVVDVGAGTAATDYAEKDVQGKIVLGTGPVGTLQQMAIFQRGALGVLSAWSPDLQSSRNPLDNPDAVTWGTGVVPESATGQPSTFGIMLSRRQREQLLELMKKGQPVKVRVTVQADFEEPGYLEAVTATIPGKESPDQEIMLSAHLDHPKPSANDNDSGSATILEVARLLQTLVRSGQLPRLKRTVRFLWVQEGRSTRAYAAAHPDLAKHVLVDINMDIVGSDPEKTKAILYYWHSPSSHPSFASDIVQDYFELVRNIDNDKMPTERLHPILSLTGSRRPFIGSVERYRRPSDQSFLISEGIPGVNFAAWPDLYHHTQFDTPEKSDPTLLARVAFIGAASAAAVASAGPKDVPSIVTDLVGHAQVRLGEDLQKGLRLLDQANQDQLDSANSEAENTVREGLLRELRNIDSVSIVAGQDQNGLGYIKEQKAALASFESSALRQIQLYYQLRAGHPQQHQQPTKAESRAQEMVPVWLDRTDPEGIFQRLEKEAVSRLRILHYTSQAAAPFVPDFNVTLFETLNFIDGKRSIKEIRDAVSAEYAPVPVDVMNELFDAMANAKLIEVKTRQR